MLIASQKEETAGEISKTLMATIKDARTLSRQAFATAPPDAKDEVKSACDTLVASLTHVVRRLREPTLSWPDKEFITLTKGIAKQAVAIVKMATV